MKDSYHNIKEIFKEDYSRVTIEFSIVEMEKGRAHCLFLKIPDEKFLLENWKGITNSIALNYQTHLETRFEKWNIYLFFLISKDLENLNLKYTIENNTFSSRKIIEDTSLSAEVLIKKHVVNELTITEDSKRSENTVFEYNPLIYSILKDKKLKNRKILAKPLEEAYDELIRKIRKTS